MRHGHALAGGQPIGLDDDGRALFAHIGERRNLVVEAGIARRWECPSRRRAALVKLFEPSSWPASPCEGQNSRDPGGAQIVAQPRHHLRVGPDHDEVDIVLAHRGDHRVMVGDVDPEIGPRRSPCRHCPAPRTACRQPRRLRDLPCQRVLAPPDPT
jgi:hypothetical protein